MTRDLANLSETLRAIDDVRKKIEEYAGILNQMKPDNIFEKKAYEYIKDEWNRYLTVRHSLEKRKEELEES
jgi:hypothetical protein